MDFTYLSDLNIYISDGNYGELYPKEDELKENGEVPFIRVNNLQNLKIVDNGMKYITYKKHAILLSGHLLNNDILITTRGDIGKVAIVDKKYENANINAQIALLRITDDMIEPYYLLEYLNYSYSYIQLLQTGSALKQLPIKNLKKIRIPVVSINEQKNYSDILKTINQRLYLEIEKEKLLNNLKKGLMQNMFV